MGVSLVKRVMKENKVLTEKVIPLYEMPFPATGVMDDQYELKSSE